MTKPIDIQTWRALGPRSRRKIDSTMRTKIWPPSKTGMGKRLRTPSWRLMTAIQPRSGCQPMRKAV